MSKKITIELDPDSLTAFVMRDPEDEVTATSLSEARTRLGLSQDELADRCGLSRVRISQLENGDNEGVSLRSARLIARTLLTTVDAIFPWSAEVRNA